MNIKEEYKRLFEDMLLSKIDINKYETVLDNNQYITPPNNVDLKYNLKSFLNSKYIFILNDFYVDDINTINEEIVSNTYKDVLIDKSLVIDGKLSFINNTNSLSDEYYVKNGDLSIGLFYNIDIKSLTTKEEYLSLNKEIDEIFKNISNDLKKEIKDYFDIDAVIFPIRK